jgi:nucleotide-binding universal stress UspA family protein
MISNVLVPVDGSDLSLKAVSEAAAIAKAMNASVTLFHAAAHGPRSMYAEGLSPASVSLDPQKAHAERERQAKQVLERAAATARAAGVDPKTDFEVNDLPYMAIVAAAQRHGSDLIAMGSHGYGAMAGILLGSQTQKVIASTRIPALIVR